MLLAKEKDWPWGHFREREVHCHGGPSCDCGGKGLPAPELMDKLEALRIIMDEPIRVTSCFRCPSYNALISGSGSAGPHTTGKAVDIAVYGSAAFTLLRAAIDIGFTGIGIRQTGPISSRFLHCDYCESSGRMVRPQLWSYS